MSQTMLWRMIWKEYRAFRTLWLTIVVVTMLLQLLVIIASLWGGTEIAADRALLLLALGMPVTFAIAVSAVSYSQEHESGTFGYLRSLPTRGMEILTARTLYCVIASIVMCLLLMLLLLAVVLPIADRVVSTIAARQIGNQILSDELPLVVLYSAVLLVGSIVCGTFFSLITHKPLRAALLTAFTICLLQACGHFVAMPEYHLAILLVPSALLALVNVGLVSRWFEERPFRIGIARDSSRMRSSTSNGGHALSRSAGRLAWLQTRTLWPMYLAYLVLIPLATFGLMLETRSLLGAGVVTVQLLTVVLGLGVFYVDHQQQGYRFLAERGISPRELWTVRQLPGLVLVVLTCGFLFFVMAEGHDFGFVPKISAAASFPLLAYASGQYCSLMSRSLIVASFVALFLTTLATAWCFLAWILQIPWVLAIAPVALALLAGSYLRMSSWILERDRWRDLAIPLLLPTIAAVVTVVGVANFRVHEIPTLSAQQRQSLVAAPMNVDSDFLSERSLLRAIDSMPKPPKDSRVAEFDQLRFNGFDQFRWSNLPLPAWWDAEGEYSLSLLEESLSSGKRIVVVSDPWSPTLNDLTLLNAVVLADARRLTRKGELDAAWQRLQMSLELSVQVRYASGTQWASQIASEIEDAAYDQMLWWAANEKQSVPRLRSAIEVVQQMSGTAEKPGERFRRAYEINRKIIEQAPESLDSLRFQPSSQWVQFVSFVYRLMSWERERSLKAFDYLSSVSHYYIDQDDKLLEKGKGLAAVLANRPQHLDARYFRSLLIPELYEWDLGFVSSYARIENRRRAMICQLTLLEWRLEHGDYPRSLEKAADELDRVLPMDVYSGRPFVYFPQGVDCRLWVRYEAPFEQVDVAYTRNHPFLWSSGELLNYVGKANFVDWQPQHSSYDFFKAGHRTQVGNFGQFEMTSEELIWQSGIIYGLPEDAKQSSN